MKYQPANSLLHYGLKFFKLVLLLLLPISTYATEIPDAENIYELVRQQQNLLQQQQQEIDELRKLVLEQKDNISVKRDRTQVRDKKTTRSSSRISINKKGLRIKSKDGDFSFRAGGRIHADYAYYDDDITSMGTGAILRRARLYFKGKFFRNWRYKTEIDFAEDGNVGPRAVWLGYDGWKPVSIKLGNFQEPFSLEEMNTSNTITFMERSLANVFAPSYHLGLAIKGYGSFWSLSTGLFGKTIGNKDDKIDDGWGISGRTTIAPVMSDNKLLHLGFSSEYRETDTNNTIRIRARPESRVTDRNLVDTRIINDVDYTWLFAGEIAMRYKSVSLQAEYIHNRVVRIQAEDLDFNGAYIQGSWFLTGESRPYNVRQGAFSLINPIHQYGALELAIRYSFIDLNDRDIAGGRQNNLTLGLNWYANYNVRFMMNYIFVDAQPNRNGFDENPNIWQIRGQLVF